MPHGKSNSTSIVVEAESVDSVGESDLSVLSICTSVPLALCSPVVAAVRLRHGHRNLMEEMGRCFHGRRLLILICTPDRASLAFVCAQGVRFPWDAHCAFALGTLGCCLLLLLRKPARNSPTCVTSAARSRRHISVLSHLGPVDIAAISLAVSLSGCLRPRSGPPPLQS